MAACRRRWSWRRSGIDVTVLERGDFGVGASTRNGGGVSGGTTMGKGFSGKGVGGDAEAWKKIMQRMLADAADSLAQVETVIQREGIECYWRMNGRFSGAYTPRHYAEQEAKVGTYNANAEPRHLHGAARAPARGDRLGLLLRRHGGGAHRPAPSGAVLRRSA